MEASALRRPLRVLRRFCGEMTYATFNFDMALTVAYTFT